MDTYHPRGFGDYSDDPNVRRQRYLLNSWGGERWHEDFSSGFLPFLGASAGSHGLITTAETKEKESI